MEVAITIIFLGIPLIGFLLRRSYQVQQRGMDLEVRTFARRITFGLGTLLLALGAVLALGLGIAVSEEMSLSGEALWLILPLLLFTALGITGWTAIQVSRHPHQRELSLADERRQSRESLRLNVCTALLILFPLLPLGLFWLTLAAGMIAVVLTFMAAFNRSRQSRLLMTLAVAARLKQPLADELDILAETEFAKSRRKLRRLADTLRNGVPLSQALAEQNLLPMDVTTAIHVAEETGGVAEALTQLATQQARSLRTLPNEATANNTVLYAWGVAIISVQIVGFVMYYIVPKFKQIFLDFGVELPEPTIALIHSADFFVEFWYLIVPVIGLPLLFLLGASYIAFGVQRRPYVLVDGLWPRLIAPQVLRALSAAAQKKETLTSSLQVLHENAAHSGLAARFNRLQRCVEGGKPLEDALLDERFISLREAHALEHAARLGHLPWALTALAQRMEDARRWWVAMIREIGRPVVVLTLGVAVFLICTALFLPLIKLLNDLS